MKIVHVSGVCADNNARVRLPCACSQGWTPDFIPHVLQEAVDNKYFHELIPVSGSYAISKHDRDEEGEAHVCSPFLRVHDL